MNAAAELMPRDESRSIDIRPTDQPGTALAHGVNPYLRMVETLISGGGDIANLDKILDLQIKWEANEARKAFVAAMAAFKAEPMEILKRKAVGYKTKEGDFVGYMHAELSDVTDAVVPAMGKHGLSHRWDIQQGSGQITVTCQITHALGHTESVGISAAPDDSGKKNKIQQVASTVSYLQRYTLLSATGMAAKGMDNDGGDSDDDPDAEPENQKDADWIRTANQLEHPDEYAAQRIKMLKDYDGVNNMPIKVREAFNAAKARVTPKDVE
jgi:hypothetical protein